MLFNQIKERAQAISIYTMSYFMLPKKSVTRSTRCVPDFGGALLRLRRKLTRLVRLCSVAIKTWGNAVQRFIFIQLGYFI